MKNKIYSLIVSLLVFLVSCEKDPEVVYETITVTETVTETVTVPATPTVPETQTVGGGGIFFIDDSQTWTNDRIWIMDGKVVVRNGGVLTIEEGTIVKAADGQGVDATALVIAKGGTLNANGTAENPVVFTDTADLLSYSNTDRISPNRVATDTGKWGGVIILGQATVGEDGGEDDIEELQLVMTGQNTEDLLMQIHLDL